MGGPASVQGRSISVCNHKIINQLNNNFPPFNPSPTDDMNMIMYKAGQRSVVEWLLDKIEEETNGN